LTRFAILVPQKETQPFSRVGTSVEEAGQLLDSLLEQEESIPADYVGGNGADKEYDSNDDCCAGTHLALQGRRARRGGDKRHQN
jgi:hypothetical protein